MKGLKKNGVKKPPERGLGRGLSSLLGDQGVAIATGMAGVTGAASNGSDIQQTSSTSVNCHFLGCAKYRWNGLMLVLGNHGAALISWRLMSLRLRLGKMASFNLYCCVHIPITNRVFNWLLVNGVGAPAQLAKIHEVPAIIRDLHTAECYEIALVENIQRIDLSVIEEAQGYQKLLDTNRYTQEQLSVIIGKSRSHIANILRLLLLPEPVQTLLLERKITMGQARPLIGHKQSEMLAKTIVMRGLSARQAEILAKHDAASTQKMQKNIRSHRIYEH